MNWGNSWELSLRYDELTNDNYFAVLITFFTLILRK